MQFHTDSMGISQTQLEAARVAAANDSPIAKAIQRCLLEVDAENIDEVVESLKGLFKHGVGLQTKVGAAKFVAALGVLNTDTLQPHAGVLLDAAYSGCTDRSEVVRSETGGAVAVLARLVPAKRLSKFLRKLKEHYGDGSDASKSLVVAGTLRQLTKHGKDCLQSHLAEVLPLAYIAKFPLKDGLSDAEVGERGDEATPEVKAATLWGDVWEDNTGSLEANPNPNPNLNLNPNPNPNPNPN